MRALRARGTPAEPGAEPTPPAAASTLARGELSDLIAGIVAVTLDTRLPDCDPIRRAGLSRDLEARLLALFQPAGTPPPPPTSDDAARDETLLDDAANRDPSSNRVFADVALEEGAPAADAFQLEYDSTSARALGLVLENRLNGLGGTLSERADLRQRLIALALSMLDSTPAPEAEGASAEDLRTLDVLQRRAMKLQLSLQEARAAVAYVSGLEHVDEGLASIYRAVQGLAPADPQRARKLDALEGIFRANLALQKPDAAG
jgi:hypothetical protein